MEFNLTETTLQQNNKKRRGFEKHVQTYNQSWSLLLIYQNPSYLRSAIKLKAIVSLHNYCDSGSELEALHGVYEYMQLQVFGPVGAWQPSVPEGSMYHQPNCVSRCTQSKREVQVQILSDMYHHLIWSDIYHHLMAPLFSNEICFTLFCWFTILDQWSLALAKKNMWCWYQALQTLYIICCTFTT